MVHLLQMESRASVFVLKFFRAPTGELCARVTDAQSLEIQAVNDAAALWRLLHDPLPKPSPPADRPGT